MVRVRCLSVCPSVHLHVIASYFYFYFLIKGDLIENALAMKPFEDFYQLLPRQMMLNV